MTMTKKSKGENAFFGIHDNIRMLNDIIPANQAVLFRYLVMARIEIDEATGELFARKGMSARQWLQFITKIQRDTSFREASAKATKLGLLKNVRVYTGGQRKEGGDKIILDRAQWDGMTVEYLERREGLLVMYQDNPTNIPKTGIQAQNPEDRDSTLSPEDRDSCPPEDRDSRSPEDRDSTYTRKTATVTATVTATHQGSKPPGGLPPAPNSLLPETNPFAKPEGVGPSCIVQPAPGCASYDGIPWVVEGATSLSGYGKGHRGKKTIAMGAPLYYDRVTCRLSFVENEAGHALYQALRDDGFAIEAIKAGITAAAGKAAGKPSEALGGLLRQYCGYAQEKIAGRQASNSAPPWETYKGGKLPL